MAAAEQKKSYAVIKQFQGLNTKANRTAIGENEFSWLENVMPVGAGNLKVVPAQIAVRDAGNNVFSFSNTVTFLTSATIGEDDYVFAAEDNGAAQYIDVVTGETGNVAVAGTFSNAGVTATSYDNTTLMLADPDRGLYKWKGDGVVEVGSVGLIVIANGGDGYITPPDVVISAPNDANGVQAEAFATITAGSGSIIDINVTNEGSGYAFQPQVTISAPNLVNGVQATAVATLAANKVIAVTVVEPGSGYTANPTVTITGGGGTGATANAVAGTGKVTGVFLTQAGSGYNAAPTITFVNGGGANATAYAQLATFKTGTVSVLLTNGGSGYSNAANITVSIGNATGYTTQATAIATISGNVVNNIIVTNPGAGYTASSNVVVTISGDTGANAAAIATVQTQQINGIASFSGRVWVAQGRTIYYSAAGSNTDFTSVSAGSFTITDSTLRGNIRTLLAANNFLYIFGDDSINVFSDVRVDSTGQTLFTNTNVSASVGTRRIYAVFPYFRSVLFMNDYGIYALVGSTTSKLSDQLDGLFPHIDFSKPVSGGQVLVNNILCAAFNFYLKSTYPFYTGGRYIQAVFFDRKWFLTSQGDITQVTSGPVNGFINLYGVTDSALFRLYGDDVSNVDTVVQTALLPMGDNIRTKQALKFAVEATLTNAAVLTVTVDNENRSSPPYTLTNNVNWTNNFGQVIPWQNNSLQNVSWLYSRGYALYKSDAQQYGKYLGLTLTSNNAAFVYNTFEFEHELRVRF